MEVGEIASLLWDTWKGLCQTDPRYQRIEDRMRRTSSCDDKMSVLADLRKVIGLNDHVAAGIEA